MIVNNSIKKEFYTFHEAYAYYRKNFLCGYDFLKIEKIEEQNNEQGNTIS